MTEITEMLTRIDSGKAQAAEELLPLLYDELRRLAAQHLSNEPAEHSLQATALVHEAYLRLVGTGTAVKWNHRGHFFLAAAQAMRRILVDRARGRRAEKRGGGRRPAALDERRHQEVAEPSDGNLIALHEALGKLAGIRPELARLVELRYFTGLSMPETAACLGVSLRTAERDWTYAKAWLKQELFDSGESGNL